MAALHEPYVYAKSWCSNMQIMEIILRKKCTISNISIPNAPKSFVAESVLLVGLGFLPILPVLALHFSFGKPPCFIPHTRTTIQVTQLPWTSSVPGTWAKPGWFFWDLNPEQGESRSENSSSQDFLMVEPWRNHSFVSAI